MNVTKKLALATAGACALMLPALASATPYAPDQGEESMSPAMAEILPLRDQAAMRDAWLETRFQTVLPQLMRENGIDMWILVAREYMEDPVVSTMLNATNLRARRRTILIFFDPGEGKPIERLVVSKHGMGTLYDAVWDMDKQPDQWARVRELVAERNPKKIALNTSSLTAFADGMTYSQYNDLVAAFTPEMRNSIVSGYPLAIGWLETRIPEEMVIFEKAVRTAHAIIGEGFSTRIVTPGKTTTEDLVWWYRQRVNDVGLGSWFHPSVSVTRRGGGVVRGRDTVIQKGDMLHVDFGVVYMGLNTDTQHLAYVLRDGESEAPAGLRAGMLDNNKVQDAVTSEFRVGEKGNDILKRAIDKSKKAGLKPLIYSHPIGYHGHGAGSTVGLTENQTFIPTGEYLIRPNIAWSIELSATRAVPEWDGQMVVFPSEEDMFFDGKTVRYIDGRQTKFHLIGDR
ncbi:MAG: Xaa-Pro aminopeptidase [Alphaproteobacteria bacterium HGW-Alphaproteobacteria-13]|jgi:hypothetical protein|nr:MAG: Xaa-Pro aminopeptidase [Alphaproteobacteria bacterium HGW-Alphaproteobacteria-13]